MYNSFDKQTPRIATFLHLVKVFDTVNHKILLEKLGNYSIWGMELGLIKCYLTDRKQTVKIANHNSIPSNVKTGVPQGTILSPYFIYKQYTESN